MMVLTSHKPHGIAFNNNLKKTVHMTVLVYSYK